MLGKFVLFIFFHIHIFFDYFNKNYPGCPLTGTFAYMYQKAKANVGKYFISGAHGYIKHIYIYIYIY